MVEFLRSNELRHFAMKKFIKRRVLASLMLAAMSVPAFAAGVEDNPGDYAMAGDILVARPIGVVLTAAGSVLFVVSLPFTAIAGGVTRGRRCAGRRSREGNVRALPGMSDCRPIPRPERRQPLGLRQLFAAVVGPIDA